MNINDLRLTLKQMGKLEGEGSPMLTGMVFLTLMITFFETYDLILKQGIKTAFITPVGGVLLEM